MFFCSFTCHNKNPFLFPHALLCLWSQPVKPCEWQIYFFPQEQWMKKSFLRRTGKRSMEPVEPSVFIYVTVYRWLTVNKLVGGGGGGCFCFHGRWGPLSLTLSLSLSLSVQEVPQTQTTLSVLCFRPGRGSQRGSGQAWVSLPGWSGPANVYDLNQPNPTGLFKGIENDLQELRWPGIGNQRKSRQSFKSVVALWLCFGSIYLDSLSCAGKSLCWLLRWQIVRISYLDNIRLRGFVTNLTILHLNAYWNHIISQFY